MKKSNNNFLKNIKDILPGFIVSVLVAYLSIIIAKFVPKLGAASIAIFLGMFVGNLFLNQDIFQKGYKFSETDLLSYSIVLLGATLSISTISEIGIFWSYIYNITNGNYNSGCIIYWKKIRIFR